VTETSWLPELIEWAAYGGDWHRYIEVVYEAFKKDFIMSRPQFRGRRLGLKRHPLFQDKEATFWHFTSEGAVESDRLPDLRRCERIRWPRPIIESAKADERVRVWATERNNELRWVIALPDFSYIVVLADRGQFLLPWTAFCVERSHSRAKLEKEYKAFLRDGVPQKS
jgi:hypothetical protein